MHYGIHVLQQAQCTVETRSMYNKTAAFHDVACPQESKAGDVKQKDSTSLHAKMSNIAPVQICHIALHTYYSFPGQLS